MGFREDFEKFRKPKEQESGGVSLPSFEDVRTSLRDIRSQPKAETTPKEDQLTRNLAKLREDIENDVSISAPTSEKTTTLKDSDILKDLSADKQGFKLSDLVIPEIRKGFQQSFGEADKGTAGDVYTEMIPSFGKSRAYEIADAYQNGVDALGYPGGANLTDAEKTQFDGWKNKHWALMALDASDLVGVGIAIKGGAAFLSRTGLRQAVSTASKMENVKEIHEELLRRLPELKNTQELDDVTNIILASREQNPDKLAKVIQKRVDNSELTPRPEFVTEAQKVTYENGVPVLRRTTPDSLTTRRAATLEAIKGNSEALRLSNADILAEEIRAGALSTKTTSDDTISVWRTSAQGRRIKNGEEVSLVEDFAKSVSEGATPQKIEVAVSDLVRLPDGTYTFAPERLIKEAPVLKYPKNISKTVVQATKKKEADAVAKKLAKEQSDKEAKRKAIKEAEEQIEKPAKEARARREALKEKSASIKAEAQRKIDMEPVVKVKEQISIKGAVKDKVAELNKQLRLDKQTIDIKYTKALGEAKTALQKQKLKIKRTNEKAKIDAIKNKSVREIKDAEKVSLAEVGTKSKARVSKIRKARDTEADAVKKELADSKGETDAIIKKASETKTTSKGMVDKINDISKNSLKNDKGGMRDKSLKFFRENPDEITKGEVRLREIEDGVLIIEDGRHRLQVASELGIKPNIVDVTAEYTGKASSKIGKLINGDVPVKRIVRGKRGGESLKPVGEGAVKESKLYESVQTRTREVRKDLGETINSKEYEFYRTASNKDQLAKAAAHIDTNGVEETVKALEIALRTGGDAVDGILNNSLLLALEPELLKAGMAKHADNLLRLSSRLSTRMGQELQILSVLDRNNPLVVLARLNNEVDKMVDGGGILGATAKKGSRADTERTLENLVKEVDVKSNIKEVVEAIKICE